MLDNFDIHRIESQFDKIGTPGRRRIDDIQYIIHNKVTLPRWPVTTLGLNWLVRDMPYPARTSSRVSIWFDLNKSLDRRI